MLEVGRGGEEHVPVVTVNRGFPGKFLRMGEAYQAHSIEMPRRRKMAYSSHDRRCLCFLWRFSGDSVPSSRGS